MQRVKTLFADLPLRHPRLALCFWVLVFAVCAIGLKNLSISYDYRSFFDDSNPELAAFNKVEQQFSATDSVNFIVHRPTGDLFNPADLNAILWLTEAALTLPYSTRVQSMANFQYSYAQGDDLLVEPLIGPLPDDEPSLSKMVTRVKERALSEPLVVRRLISADGRTAQIITTIRLPADGGNVLPDIQAAVDQLRDGFRDRAPGLTLATTGVVMLSATFFDITVQDMLVLFPIMSILIAVLLRWFFGSTKAAGLCLLIISGSIVMAMGIAGWFQVQLTPATGPAPVVIMTVALVDAVHIIASFLRLSQTQDRLHAAKLAVHKNLRPILLTSLTTIIGFLSLNFSDTPPFRELGNISALGTVFAGLISVTLLPALLCLTGVSSNKTGRSRTAEKLTGFAGHIRPLCWIILALGSGLAITAAVFVARLSVEDTFIEWVGSGQSFRKDAEFIQERLPSLFSLQFSVKANVDGGVTDPAYLKDLNAFAQWLTASPQVSHVASFDQILRRLNQNMHADDPGFYRLPETNALAAQYLLLYELSLPMGEDLTNILTIDRTESRLVATLTRQSSREMRVLRQQALDWARENMTAAHLSAGVGTNMIFAELTASNTRAMFIGSLVAAIGISLVLIIALGDWKLGLVSLVPNVLPPLFAFGLWSAGFGTVGLYGAFVVAVALGLVVDATVHFLEKYQLYSKAGSDNPVATSMADVGPAILISSAVLVAGFGVLTFSSFALIGLLSQLVLLTLIFAILADFILLPALLYSLQAADSSG
ncbi:MAG: MMPL family transporter [Pseudomonadota bacterium]